MDEVPAGASSSSSDDDMDLRESGEWSPQGAALQGDFSPQGALAAWEQTADQAFARAADAIGDCDASFLGQDAGAAAAGPGRGYSAEQHQGAAGRGYSAEQHQGAARRRVVAGQYQGAARRRVVEEQHQGAAAEGGVSELESNCDSEESPLARAGSGGETDASPLLWEEGSADAGELQEVLKPAEGAGDLL